MALAGQVGAVYVQASETVTAFLDEATIANATHTRYTITDPAKRYWAKSQAVTVKKNGALQTGGFSLEYPGGVVVFDAPLLDTDVVTVSGNCLTVAQAGGFFNWALDEGLDTAEVTTFGSGGWKEYLPTLKGFSGSAEAYWGNEAFFTKLGTEVVLVLYLDAGANKYRFEGYGIITGDGLKDSLDAVIQESISFQGTGPLYYREG